MHRKTALIFALGSALGLAGCFDDDDDGLSNQDEKKAGTDPENPDSDADGVSDGEEVELGIDPLAADTDGDGYRDGDEIAEGSDPADGDDGIFEGGFPFNPNLDDWDPPSFSDAGGAGAGDAVPRYLDLTQFDEEYNIYHMAGSAQYLILDSSAVWCPPCNAMADWLDGADNGFMPEAFDPLRDAVHEDEVRWITALAEDGSGNPAELVDVEGWYDDYPTENVPVMVDGRRNVIDWIRPPGIPSLSLINLETMEIEMVDDMSGVMNEVLGWVEAQD